MIPLRIVVSPLLPNSQEEIGLSTMLLVAVASLLLGLKDRWVAGFRRRAGAEESAEEDVVESGPTDLHGQGR